MLLLTFIDDKETEEIIASSVESFRIYVWNVSVGEMWGLSQREQHIWGFEK